MIGGHSARNLGALSQGLHEVHKIAIALHDEAVGCEIQYFREVRNDERIWLPATRHK
jgi:hypothetical protein